jgi:N-succinyldiaminopimelate aminotransferase
VAAETIFTTMTRLAVETGAVNLGQGFPDAGEPPALLDAAAAALRAAAAGVPVWLDA